MRQILINMIQLLYKFVANATNLYQCNRTVLSQLRTPFLGRSIDDRSSCTRSLQRPVSVVIASHDDNCKILWGFHFIFSKTLSLDHFQNFSSFKFHKKLQIPQHYRLMFFSSSSCAFLSKKLPNRILVKDVVIIFIPVV